MTVSILRMAQTIVVVVGTPRQIHVIINSLRWVRFGLIGRVSYSKILYYLIDCEQSLLFLLLRADYNYFKKSKTSLYFPTVLTSCNIFKQS